MSKDEKAQRRVSRLPNSVGAKAASGVLEAPPKARLAIRATFIGEPVANLAVAFHARKDDGSCGDALSKDGLKTDGHGVAAHDEPVEIGNYFCRIERQPDAEIPTVPAADQPFEIPLPVGRPSRDLR